MTYSWNLGQSSFVIIIIIINLLPQFPRICLGESFFGEKGRVYSNILIL